MPNGSRILNRITTWFEPLSAAALTACAMLILGGCELDLEDDDGDVRNRSALSIEPASVTLDAAATNAVLFSIDGGTASFSWTVTDPSLGRITPDGDIATYNSLSATGQNFVIVTDADTNAVTAVVTQQ